MRQSFAAALATGLLVTSAVAQEPLALRDMGSFHVGGRKVEVTGQPVKEIVRVPGGPMSKLDLNGTYHVEHMYAQYFLVQNRKGKWPLLMWHGGGLTGATYETTPDGREGWRDMMIRRGWDVYITDATERGRIRLRDPADLEGRSDLPHRGRSLGALPHRHRARARSMSIRRKRKLLPGNQFPIEAYDNVHEADRAALAVDRRSHHRRLCRAHRQGLPVRDPRAQPGRPLCLPRRRAASRQGQSHGLGRAGDPPAAALRRRSRTCRCCWSTATTSIRTRAGSRTARRRLPMPTPCARPAARSRW